MSRQDEERKRKMDEKKIKLGFVSTYPPRACGIATFTQDLVQELEKVPGMEPPVVVAMDQAGLPYGARVKLTIAQDKQESYRKAAYMLNRSPLDLIVVEHEYGIFGGADGAYILEFAKKLEKPLITTLHTVLPKPSANQRHILQELARYSQRIVTMAERSKKLLECVYGIPARKIAVIPHGVPMLEPSGSAAELKERAGLRGRTVVSTFGLLSPGKGIEYGIEAIAKEVQRHPELMYLILGKTHPCVKEAFGEAYRDALVARTEKLGIEEHVRFVNKYLTKAEIVDALAMSDIYMTPYLGRDQAVSGTLAYAAGYGKVIVSTPYRYAEEMLAGGRGLLAAFADADSLAARIEEVLQDDKKKKKMERKMQELGRKMLWDHVASCYAALFLQVLTEHGMHRESQAG